MIYLASPYSKYAAGHQAAYQEAARITGALVLQGLHIFSPIVHGHPLSVYGTIDPLDHDLWARIDRQYMRLATTCIVAMMDGWQDSRGVTDEIEQFTQSGKPVLYLNPETLLMKGAPA